MVIGAYPFEDPSDARNFRKTIARIVSVNFSFPANVALSNECTDLIKKIFVVDTAKRYTIANIKSHPWFLKNLPAELQTSVTNDGPPPGEMQDLDQLMRVVDAAKRRGDGNAQGLKNGTNDFYPDDDDDMMDGSGQFSGDYEQYD
tara:strand:+ start:13644 stop:14078 length:435 start_codon:yes stop_codon:yes gene_type:complete